MPRRQGAGGRDPQLDGTGLGFVAWPLRGSIADWSRTLLHFVDFHAADFLLSLDRVLSEGPGASFARQRDRAVPTLVIDQGWHQRYLGD